MRIEKLLGKLEPLLPKEVQHWRRVLETGDAQIRSLVESHVFQVARKHLGDFDSKLLLTMPSERQARGAINLGTLIYEKPKWPVGISDGELLQNLSIFGRSGAGKTNVAFHLLEQLVAKKVPFVFLDWKRTARHLLPRLKTKVNLYTPGRTLSPFHFNPFVAPPGIDAPVYARHLIDALADAYTLGEGAKRIVQKAIINCSQPGGRALTTDGILAEIEAMEAKNKAAAWKASALRALESLSFANLTSDASTSHAELAKSLVEESSIIELDALDESSKSFLVPLFCFWLYSVMMVSPRREQLGLCIFVEEAHHLLFHGEHRAKETLMNQLLRQGREVGVSFIVIDQNPSQISRAALNNTYTTICLNLKDSSDINRAAGICLLDDEEKNWLSMLPVGQGVVKLQDRWRRPMLVQFPLVSVNKGYMSDARVKAYIEGKLSTTEISEVRRKTLNGEELRGTSGRYLSEDEFKFLHDVACHLESVVRDRYRRLGIGVNKGHAVKERLVKQGWLVEQIFKLGKTRKINLKIPSQARDALGIDFPSIHATHLTHEYWKRFYASVFQEKGYEVQMEAPRVNGRVDVLAVKDGKRIAIEIETGKSDVVGNVKACLLLRVQYVVVAATCKSSKLRIGVRLERSGLLDSNRIVLVARGDNVIPRLPFAPIE